MDAEDFFARWSRRNAQAKQEPKKADGEIAGKHEAGDEHPQPTPTIEDVAALTPQSDFSRFVARGVDEQVRRSALKKLFADPRFNVMDGLDVYIDDYSKFTPLPAAVLAALNHARGMLNPLELFDKFHECAEEDADGKGKATTDADTDEGASVRGDVDTPPPTATLPDRSDHGDPIQDM